MNTSEMRERCAGQLIKLGGNASWVLPIELAPGVN
jgi:hypothetical protein